MTGTIKLTMTCVLLDDELPGLQYLKLVCLQIPGLEVVRAYNDPQKLLRDAPTLDFDFAVLDIHMPGIDGLAVAEAIRGRPVIFVTGHQEYAADAFDLDAVDFIRKPLDKERFEQAIRKLSTRLPAAPAAPAFARLNSAQGKILLYFDQVLLISAADGDPRDKQVTLRNGQILLKNISFTQLLALLPADQFRQVNKQTLVALKAVSYYNATEVTVDLPGGKRSIPLSETYRPGFHYKK